MRRRDLLAAAAAATIPGRSAWGRATLPLTAATPGSAPGENPRVRLETGQGVILLQLFADKAPLTAADFLRYVDAGRYDGSTIYRALKAAAEPPSGLIQGGARFDPAHPIAPVAHEPTSQTGLTHKDGTLSLARRAPGTATSDFFICVGDAPYLDADPKAPGDNLGFAAFGQVIDGMDVARKILVLPTSPTAGAPDMAGQMLDPPVSIVTARRI